MTNNDGSLKGVADIVFDDIFVVKGIRIMEGEKGLFVSMPSRKVGNEYKQDCFPITADFREKLNNTILEAYNNKLNHTEEQTNDVQNTATDGKQTSKNTDSSGGAKSKKQNEIHTAQKNAVVPENTDSSGIGMNM